jgi:hypothetical protein
MVSAIGERGGLKRLTAKSKDCLMHQALATLRGWEILGSSPLNKSRIALRRRGLLGAGCPTLDGWRVVEILLHRAGMNVAARLLVIWASKEGVSTAELNAIRDSIELWQYMDDKDAPLPSGPEWHEAGDFFSVYRWRRAQCDHCCDICGMDIRTGETYSENRHLGDFGCMAYRVHRECMKEMLEHAGEDGIEYSWVVECANDARRRLDIRTGEWIDWTKEEITAWEAEQVERVLKWKALGEDA